MATRAVARPNTDGKISKHDAAQKIAGMLEEHMTECRLSDAEKNERVKQFGKRVKDAIRQHAKRP